MTALATIPASDFVFLCRFASTAEETRFYLRGVFVEPLNGAVVAVASDGHRLGSISFLDGEAMCSAPVIIPADRELLRLAKAKLPPHLARANVARFVSIYADRVDVFDAAGLDDDAGRWPVTTLALKPIDGPFPDWRRVIVEHKAPEGEREFAFNAGYVADFAAGPKDQQVSILVNGDCAAYVTNSDQRFFGLLMPSRAAINGKIAEMVAQADRVAGRALAEPSAIAA